jgi:hypothetical protein
MYDQGKLHQKVEPTRHASDPRHTPKAKQYRHQLRSANTVALEFLWKACSHAMAGYQVCTGTMMGRYSTSILRGRHRVSAYSRQHRLDATWTALNMRLIHIELAAPITPYGTQLGDRLKLLGLEYRLCNHPTKHITILLMASSWYGREMRLVYKSINSWISDILPSILLTRLLL